MKFHQSICSMIGKLYEPTFQHTDCDIALCPHKCLLKAVPLCQMPQTELSHLEITCPLRRARRDPLNRLFHSTTLLKIITLYFGICLTIAAILMWSQSCKSSSIKPSVETGLTTPKTTPTMKCP